MSHWCFEGINVSRELTAVNSEHGKLKDMADNKLNKIIKVLLIIILAMIALYPIAIIVLGMILYLNS